MVVWFLAGSILVPAAASLSVFLLPKRTLQAARCVVVGAACLASLSNLLLLASPKDGVPLSYTWLPGSGPMGISLDATALWAALATSCSAIIAWLATGDRQQTGVATAAVNLMALSAAGMAFLADHFLARYVALEIVALAVPLAMLAASSGPTRTLAGWSSYLLLRLGDAGLLAAILILKAATGSLLIGPTLQAASELETGRLSWVVAGFLLAVWVKMGVWPFHTWALSGRGLDFGSQAWLYVTLVPNLGAYLLYRMTPLLRLTDTIRLGIPWIASVCALISAVIAFRETNVRRGAVHIGGAIGGTLMLGAAFGIKPVAWLGLLALTPLRLLLLLGGDMAIGVSSSLRRWLASSCLALAGLLIAFFGILTVWWAREASGPRFPVIIAEAAVVLLALWTLRIAWRLAKIEPLEQRPASSTMRVRWALLALLSGSVLFASLSIGPLFEQLAAATQIALPALPSPLALARTIATSPAFWVALLVSLVVRPVARGPSAPEGRDLEQALIAAAQVLRDVAEVGFLERVLIWVVRNTLAIARFSYLVLERGLFERALARMAHNALAVARFGYLALERGFFGAISAQADIQLQKAGRDEEIQRTLVEAAEHSSRDIFRLAAKSVLAVGRSLQRVHTGRLRHNLYWIPLCLVVATIVFLLLAN